MGCGDPGRARCRADTVTHAPRRLPTAGLVSVVEGGAGAVERVGHEVAVDLVGDLDAPVAKPPGHLGDRDTPASAVEAKKCRSECGMNSGGNPALAAAR